MKSTLSNVLLFAAGAGLGVAATWKYFKTKYERIAREEIDSVYATIAKREKKAQDSETDISAYTPDKEDEADYVDVLKDLGYADKEVEFMAKPYVIAPEEFGEVEDYETETLTYYEGDGVLVDDISNEVIEDVESLVGEDSLQHFGEYEPDSVHVRNDRAQCDYEILLDTRCYSDVKDLLPVKEEG